MMVGLASKPGSYWYQSHVALTQKVCSCHGKVATPFPYSNRFITNKYHTEISLLSFQPQLRAHNLCSDIQFWLGLLQNLAGIVIEAGWL